MDVFFHFIFSEEKGLFAMQNVVNSIDRVKVRLQANVNFDLVIELLIMAIKENS